MTQLPEAVSANPTPSAPARPEYSYSWESFEEAGRELLPLMRLHWKEKFAWRDVVEMDVDWARLFEMERRGMLHLLVVRADGVAVGYMPMMIAPHIMSGKLLMAVIETYVMHPAYRDGWTLVKMLKRCSKKAKALGASVITCRDSDGDLKHVMRRLGFGMPETTYFKRLDLTDE